MVRSPPVTKPIEPRERRPQRIAVLPGDGVGREVIAEATRVIEAAAARWSLPLELVEHPYGAEHYLATGVTLPPGQMESFRDDYAAILLGAFGDPRVPDNRHAADILLGLRFQLDLYINFRPCKLYDARLCPLKNKREEDVDFVVFRENTEGMYAGIGGSFKVGTPDELALQEEVNTRKGVERIVRAAFEFARAAGRREVVMADKANAMPHGHGLWRRTFAEVAREFSEIRSRAMYVDAVALQLVRAPESFDVIVSNNLFGDILTDLGAALQGGLGVAASANRHPGRTSMYEPVHGSAPDIAGTGTANPVGAILSAALMLGDLGHLEAAAEIERAAIATLRAGETTPDLGGGMSTSAVGDRIARAVAGVALSAR